MWLKKSRHNTCIWNREKKSPGLEQTSSSLTSVAWKVFQCTLREANTRCINYIPPPPPFFFAMEHPLGLCTCASNGSVCLPEVNRQLMSKRQASLIKVLFTPFWGCSFCIPYFCLCQALTPLPILASSTQDLPCFPLPSPLAYKSSWYCVFTYINLDITYGIGLPGHHCGRTTF